MVALVFGSITVAWLAYLLPWLLKHRGQTVETSVDPVDGFDESLVFIRRGESSSEESALTGRTVVTPLSRKAARTSIAMQARTAVRRRRIGLVLGLVVSAAGAAVPALVPVLPWWVAGIGPVMVVLWAIVAHASVGIVGRRLDHELYLLEHGWDEPTCVIEAPAASFARHEHSVDLSAPLASSPAPRHPMPVVAASYLSRPVRPRSVRTIDLEAPLPPRMGPAFPVSASYPQDVLPLFGQDEPRAAGE